MDILLLCTTCLVLAADRSGNDFCIILHKYSASGNTLGVLITLRK